MNKKTILVLGSPRSGTSLTAGILTILGVDMGKNRGSDYLNPTGYFEDTEVLSLSDEIFRLANPFSHGFNPPKIDEILSIKHLVDDKIKHFVNTRLKNARNDLIGWKFTAGCFTIDLFMPYLINPHLILVFRNPLNIAQSISKYTAGKNYYKDLTVSKSLTVALEYLNQIHTLIMRYNDIPMLFVSYEDLTTSPLEVAELISQFLDVPLTRTMESQITNFVKSPSQMIYLKRCKKLIDGIKNKVVLLKNILRPS